LEKEKGFVNPVDIVELQTHLIDIIIFGTLEKEKGFVNPVDIVELMRMEIYVIILTHQNIKRLLLGRVGMVVISG
jgi:hypothetical protein